MEIVEIVDLTVGRGALARATMLDLPEWFGRPDALEAYARDADALPMLAARVAGEAAGFLSLRPMTAAATEAHVLGVARRWHRQGLGRALFAAAERRLAASGTRFLTVKTVSADVPDPYYAATRRFYEAIGFLPLEVFPTLWDERTPCLLLVKPLAVPPWEAVS